MTDESKQRAEVGAHSFSKTLGIDGDRATSLLLPRFSKESLLQKWPMVKECGCGAKI